MMELELLLLVVALVGVIRVITKKNYHEPSGSFASMDFWSGTLPPPGKGDKE